MPFVSASSDNLPGRIGVDRNLDYQCTFWLNSTYTCKRDCKEETFQASFPDRPYMKYTERNCSTDVPVEGGWQWSIGERLVSCLLQYLIFVASFQVSSLNAGVRTRRIRSLRRVVFIRRCGMNAMAWLIVAEAKELRCVRGLLLGEAHTKEVQVKFFNRNDTIILTEGSQLNDLYSVIKLYSIMLSQGLIALRILTRSKDLALSTF